MSITCNQAKCAFVASKISLSHHVGLSLLCVVPLALSAPMMHHRHTTLFPLLANSHQKVLGDPPILALVSSFP